MQKLFGLLMYFFVGVGVVYDKPKEHLCRRLLRPGNAFFGGRRAGKQLAQQAKGYM